MFYLVRGESCQAHEELRIISAVAAHDVLTVPDLPHEMAQSADVSFR